MALWRRKSNDPAPRLPPDVEPQIRAFIDQLSVPCTWVSVGDQVVEPWASYLGGHPYWPAGSRWPVIDGEPAAFVCQVNFAEVPRLPGFPSMGLLQWFTGADDVAGLTFDDSAGAAGFEVRWFADLGLESERHPLDAVPAGGDNYLGSPIPVPPGSAIRFESGSSIPAWDDLPGDSQQLPLLADLAAAVGREGQDPAYVYEEYVRGQSAPDPRVGRQSKVGGYPSFVQEDPRGSGQYPAADTSAGRLLVELDSSQVGGWGDGGIGHLFGDPGALAAGDLSLVRYHWDCS